MHEKQLKNPSVSQLEADLAALKETQKQPESLVASSKAGKAASDFAAAALVGMGLGFGVDYAAGSLPWGMIAGLLLGVAAGFRILLRMTSGTERSGAGEN